MKKELGYVAAVIFLLTEAVPGELHFDVSGGISLQSEYRYYHDQPAGDGAQWLTFDPLNSFCALSRWSIDVWKDRFRFGVSSGFMRRYELRMHTNNGDESIREKTGENDGCIGRWHGLRSPTLAD